MKKVIFIALAFALVSLSSVNAQSYKPFKVGLGFLYAVPTGDGAGGGVGFYLEPKYNINDKFDMGFLIEDALLVQNIPGLASSVSGVASYSITGDYMLGSGKVRPFIGTGIGLYSLGSVDASVDLGGTTIDAGSVSLGTKFGFSPRIGINLSHFQLELQYHLIMGQETYISKNYLGIKVGVEFGGGLK